MWIKAYLVKSKDGGVARSYLYDGVHTVRVYNSNDEMTHAFTITRYDLELKYQQTGERYPDSYVLEECEEYDRENF